jgi:hypothetical protein
MTHDLAPAPSTPYIEWAKLRSGARYTLATSAAPVPPQNMRATSAKGALEDASWAVGRRISTVLHDTT